MKILVTYTAIAAVDVPTDDMAEAERLVNGGQVELLKAADLTLVGVLEIGPVGQEPQALKRFCIGWEDDNEPDRNVLRTADGLEGTLAEITLFLKDDVAYDEDKDNAWREDHEGDPDHEDVHRNALEMFTEQLGGDVRAFLSQMAVGDVQSIKCENGTFEVTRDR